MGKTKSVNEFGEDIIKSVDDDDLPLELKRTDHPLGMKQHHFNIITAGLISQGCMLYYLLYLVPLQYVSIYTVLINTVYGYIMGLGTTVGAHRYWTHKTFKANIPLQIILMLLQAGQFQYPIYKWCRDHRVHHKYTDTNADPHNAARGFWFSHITWLFYPKHPDVEKALKTVDMSDLAKDPIVRFQTKYYFSLFTLVALVVPMGIMHLIIPELSLFYNFIANWGRVGFALHITFLVNSVAHIWGNKPYDKHISSSENKLVSILAIGEGWHNYHHTFPWDYKTAELGYKYNLSTAFIDFFAWIGWAYDLKTVSHNLLVDRINRTGDGSHPLSSANSKTVVDNNAIPSNVCWGWGDRDLKKEDVEITETLYPAKSLSE